MPIDPAILFQLHAPFDPTDYAARNEQLRSMQNGNILQGLTIKEKQRALQDKNNMEAAATAAYQPPPPVTTQQPPIQLGGTTLPGAQSTVQGPAQFDRAKFLSTLAQTNPLDAMGMGSQFAANDLNQQKEQVGIAQQVQGMHKNDLEMALTKIKTANQQLGSVLALPPEMRPQGYAQVVQGLKQNGLLDPNHPEQYPGDEAIKGELAQTMSAEQIFKQENDKRDFAYKQQQDQAELSSKTKDTAEGVMQYNPKTQKYDTRIGSPTKALQVGAPGSSPNDPQLIADAIESGDQPPTLKGLYRNGAAVRAELSRRGFNLSRAETDWNAVQKHVATLNGPQQVRLQQAVSTASDSLDKIEGLYNEWKQLGPNSGIKVFNRASLAAAKNLPGRTGAVAQALEAQIADLTAELGVVYMGGNSPTDHGLSLAKQNLSSDWNDQTFAEGLKQARANIAIRRNSILNTQPVGISSSSPYAPPNAAPSAGAPAPAQGNNFFSQFGGTQR